MPVFAVMATSDDPELYQRIQKKFPKNFYRITGGQWLIDTNETTKFVAEALGAPEEASTKFVVFKVESYYGLHDMELWDWMELPRSNGD